MPDPTVTVISAPVKKGDFLSSIGDFFGDVAKGFGVVTGDVVHALGVAGATVGAALVMDVSVNVIPALKTYLLNGGALNPAGIATVAVGSLLTGLVALAAKSPNNVIATASTLVTPVDVTKATAVVVAEVTPAVKP